MAPLSRRVFLLAAGAATTEGLAAPVRRNFSPRPASATPLDVLENLSGTQTDAAPALRSFLDASGPTVELSGDYYLDSCVEIPPHVTALDLTSGSRLKVRGDYSALSRTGRIDFREVLQGQVAVGTSRFAGNATYAPGEIILISSYDVVPNSPDKYGYLRQIAQVDSSWVTLDAPVPRALVTQPRTGIVTLAPSVALSGQGQILSTTPTVTRAPLVRFFAVLEPQVAGITVHSSGGSGVEVTHCSGGLIDCTVQDLLDDGTTYFGYGVEVRGATRNLVVRGKISRVRHAVTTNAGPQIESIGPAGEPEACHFEPVVADCTDKSIDTHRLGWGTTIVPHVTGGRGGVQIRADNTIVRGGSITATAGPGVAVHSSVTTPPTIEDVQFLNLKASGTAVLCAAPAVVRRPFIRDCYGENIVLSRNCRVEGGSISAGNPTGVRFNGSNNVVVDIQLGASVTTPYVESAGASNNSFSAAPPVDIVDLPAPYALSLPTITGTPSVGTRLGSTPGTWSMSNLSLSYQWLRGTTEIPLAKYTTYVLTSQDAGQQISLRISASRVGYATGSARAAAVTALNGDALTATTQPTVTGTPQPGAWITMSNGVWSPGATAWKYEWLLDGAVVATGNRTQVKSAWVGKKVSARVTASRDGWNPGVATTPAVTVSAASFVLDSPPIVSGTNSVGQWVSVSNGSWTPYPAAWKYEWLVDGVVVGTGNRIQVKSAWLGKKLSARVTVTRDGWTSTNRVTSPKTVEPGLFKMVTAPVVSGSVTGGSFVTMSNGSWDPGPTSWRYEWLLDGVVVATGNRTQVRLAWKGGTLRARVTVGREGWLTASGTSGSAVVG